MFQIKLPLIKNTSFLEMEKIWDLAEAPNDASQTVVSYEVK